MRASTVLPSALLLVGVSALPSVSSDVVAPRAATYVGFNADSGSDNLCGNLKTFTVTETDSDPPKTACQALFNDVKAKDEGYYQLVVGDSGDIPAVAYSNTGSGMQCYFKIEPADGTYTWIGRSDVFDLISSTIGTGSGTTAGSTGTVDCVGGGNNEASYTLSFSIYGL